MYASEMRGYKVGQTTDGNLYDVRPENMHLRLWFLYVMAVHITTRISITNDPRQLFSTDTFVTTIKKTRSEFIKKNTTTQTVGD